MSPRSSAPTSDSDDGTGRCNRTLLLLLRLHSAVDRRERGGLGDRLVLLVLVLFLLPVDDMRTWRRAVGLVSKGERVVVAGLGLG